MLDRAILIQTDLTPEFRTTTLMRFSVNRGGAVLFDGSRFAGHFEPIT